VGEIVTATVTAAGAVIVTVALADLVVSATLVAVTVAVVFDVTVGAVYSPELLIVPFVAVHVTPVLVVPVTVAVNCCVPLEASVALVGEATTVIADTLVPKNSAMDGAVEAAPGNPPVIPRASMVSRSVLWYW